MSVKQVEDGSWFVEIDRKEMPRTRRGGFESEEAARIFERDYMARNSPRNDGPTDKRTLQEIVGVWWVCHGINLEDGRKRRRALLQMADELKNPIANELDPEQFIGYRYEKTHGDGAISVKTFNMWHEYLDSAFARLNKLSIIDYRSPVDEIEFVKV
jgi:hypothetical protein